MHMTKKTFFTKYLKPLFWILLLIAAIYGAGRLYFRITDGFTVGNIKSELAYNPNWKTHSLSAQENAFIKNILSQKFTYLGKGCQSYVFLSEDGQYVLKFVKYQRFTPQRWLDYFAFLPFMDRYRLGKIEKKKKKLDMLFTSWKTAYDFLQPETGLIYVHLNKTPDIDQTLVIYDKMGFEHHLEMKNMEFLIQKKATMLCKAIDNLAAAQDIEGAKNLIDLLLSTILFEYERGFADNDHALMQNTGVLNGVPVHIDAGQFVRNEDVKRPEIYKQELFSKTFKFRKWLQKNHPELAVFLEDRLVAIIGEGFYAMKPQVKNHAWSE